MVKCLSTVGLEVPLARRFCRLLEGVRFAIAVRTPDRDVERHRRQHKRSRMISDARRRITPSPVKATAWPLPRASAARRRRRCGAPRLEPLLAMNPLAEIDGGEGVELAPVTGVLEVGGEQDRSG